MTDEDLHCDQTDVSQLLAPVEIELTLSVSNQYLPFVTALQSFYNGINNTEGLDINGLYGTYIFDEDVENVISSYIDFLKEKDKSMYENERVVYDDYDYVSGNISISQTGNFSPNEIEIKRFMEDENFVILKMKFGQHETSFDIIANKDNQYRRESYIVHDLSKELSLLDDMDESNQIVNIPNIGNYITGLSGNNIYDKQENNVSLQRLDRRGFINLPVTDVTLDIQSTNRDGMMTTVQIKRKLIAYRAA